MKNVVITGSTKGIGRCLPRHFAAEGHNVLVSGRSQQAVDHAVENVRRTAKGKVVGQPADVTRKQDHEALWAAAAAAFGSVDIWINNAGVARTTYEIVNTPDDHIASMIDTNMYGTVFGSQVAAMRMLDQGYGRIFNMLGGGSDGSIRDGMGIYGATKRGLDYFTRALAKEMRGTPVVVGQIRPGLVVTEGMIREANEDRHNFEKHRRVMNILCDEVDTVAPWLVARVLATSKSGAEISWMTTGRVARKFLLASFKKRDLFSDKLPRLQE